MRRFGEVCVRQRRDGEMSLASSGPCEIAGVKNLAVSSQRAACRRARRGRNIFGAGALASLQESRRSREVA
eukprot:4381177-Prymnesium_polylepis.1